MLVGEVPMSEVAVARGETGFGLPTRLAALPGLFALKSPIDPGIKPLEVMLDASPKVLGFGAVWVHGTTGTSLHC